MVAINVPFKALPCIILTTLKNSKPVEIMSVGQCLVN